ncbi:MGH1-like glycoside hydrolase domain-containing protein [Subtercola boreus]|uniref:MGH1-like glycoside hydrolase domain-containing protein n=1 Tax=Subtercola boreus TaxID=120213 RepID=UPI001C0EA92B|nr:LamG-like jellyroll fold domain-containing protein [Subtercola boreus]
MRNLSVVAAATVLLFAAAAATPAAAAAPAAAPAALPAAGPAGVYPAVGAGTHFLDHTADLQGFTDPAWYESNIPFVDLPSKSIEDVYYYRWRVYREHLRYTNPTDGYISTEFLDCCGYAAPYQAVNAAAGHQITEGRWLRDPQYVDDFTKFWLTGPGAGAKPMTDGVNKDTDDWAHEYSFWLASAAYGRAQVTGDFTQVKALLPQLISQYEGWSGQYNADLGLYWSVPVWDAMELSASSYQSDDPYHGGAGYRPTLNSYQYGDAISISRIASMMGDRATASKYSTAAANLKTSMQKWLWDPSRQFYFAMARDDNPNHTLLDTREEIGYIPWAFGAASATDSDAWKQLTDPQGFAAPFGPTTAERRSPLFMFEAGGCCRWDGPSWPFSTSQTLTGLANQLDDYPAQTAITKADYAKAVETYALTQYKDGKPYVAEAHDPDQSTWIYDGANHSEDYNHSTFNDLVLSGLLGLRPQDGTTLQIKPLVDASWDHYAVENVPYHSHNISVLWDADGSHYGQGAGMGVYVDGKRVTFSKTLKDTTVTLRQVAPTGAAVAAASAANTPGTGQATASGAATRLVNDAANPLRQGYPKPIASYTFPNDDAWNPLDGKIWYTEVPENTRWTNYASPNASGTDYYGVDFGVPTAVSDLRWFGYDDGGGVRPAADYRVQYLAAGGWLDVPGQVRAPGTPVGNGLNRITFAPVTTTQVRLLFTNPAGSYVGVTELQSWSPSSSAATVAISSGSGAGGVGAPGAPGSSLSIDGPTPVSVTVTNASPRPLAAAATALAVPPGWTSTVVSQPSAAQRASIRPGASLVWTSVLTPPSGSAPGTQTDLVATATYRDGAANNQSTHARQALTVAYPAGQQAPIGLWSLDEGAGATAADSSGAGHDLTLAGGAAWVAAREGATGSALQFDGSLSYAQTAGPVLDTVGNFSVSAWVKLDSTGSFATAVSQDGAGTSAFFLQYSKADDRLAFSTEQGRALSNVAPVTGRWYQLTGVHDANTGRFTLFVDGVAQTQSFDQAPGVASTGPLAVGRAQAGGRNADFWAGAVDDVQVYNRALSAADVAALASGGH